MTDTDAYLRGLAPHIHPDDHPEPTTPECRDAQRAAGFLSAVRLLIRAATYPATAADREKFRLALFAAWRALSRAHKPVDPLTVQPDALRELVSAAREAAYDDEPATLRLRAALAAFDEVEV